MSDLSFTAEDAAFQAALRSLARVSKKSYGEVIVASARLLAVNLAFQTQPFGDGPDAKLAGEKAVMRDLAKLYGTAPRAFQEMAAADEASAKGFYKAMLQGDTTEARRILSSSSSRWRNVEVGPFNASLHQPARNNRGRISRRVPAQIVSGGHKKLDAYVKRKVRMVGFTKAGWAHAAMSLTGNTRGIPQFVTRHKSQAPGRAVNQSDSLNDPHVVLHNDVSHIRVACPPGQMAAALSIQRGKMLSQVRHATTAAARKTFGTIATITAA